MYVKIPNFVGKKNINITMEYVQEDEDPTQFIEKKKGNSSVLVKEQKAFIYTYSL